MNSLYCAGQDVLLGLTPGHIPSLLHCMRVCLQDTLRPAYHRAAWSLTCALEGRRPRYGPSGTLEDLSAHAQRLQTRRPQLSRSFAVVEFRGDWKFQLQCWGLKRHWATKYLCHRCNATRAAKYGGPVFSAFGHNWKRFTNAEAIIAGMGPAPNPMILVPGFHISLLNLG